MNWLLKTMQAAPEIAVFLTMAVGFAVGKFKFKGFALGPVTGVLLVGVVVGQLNLSLPPALKSTFFLIFLFAVGYGVGPQFVQSLKKDGLPQILFSAIICILCLAVTWAGALIAHLNIGDTAGLFAGANTISAVIGVASDMIGQLSLSPEQKHSMVNAIPVAYAVTYIFGTIGTAWFLAYLGPKILGGDIVKQCREYEDKLGGSIKETDPMLEEAYDGASFRVIKAESNFFDKPQTVKSLEDKLVLNDWPIYVERIRKNDGTIINEPTDDTILEKGDHMVLNGPLDSILNNCSLVGTEVLDLELLNFNAGELKVVVSNKAVVDKTLQELKVLKERHGVIIKRIKRGKLEMPLINSLKIQRGDNLVLEGRKKDVERFGKYLGYVDRPTNMTDILYVCAGIFIGAILGSLTLHTRNIPISLSASGGVLVVGIVFGWWRSLRPTFGAVPEPAIWLMNNLGLNMFIAIVGISAGPDFVQGLREVGLSLFLTGIVVSIVPMFFGLLIGKYIFKFHPGINLGACAGARVTTAALGALQDSTKSKVPALSYTTTYAVGNTFLIICGVIIVILSST